jgi:hypothetical protein
LIVSATRISESQHDTITLMPTEHIVQLLIQERDRLSRAIEALQGPVKRRGRPPKNSAMPAPVVEAPKKRKPFSAATKRKMARAQKKRWAAKNAAAEK